MHMHGFNYHDKHSVVIAGGTNTRTSELFKILNDFFQKSIDIVFIPCHVKAALKEIDVIPLGS